MNTADFVDRNKGDKSPEFIVAIKAILKHNDVDTTDELVFLITQLVV